MTVSELLDEIKSGEMLLKQYHEYDLDDAYAEGWNAAMKEVYGLLVPPKVKPANDSSGEINYHTGTLLSEKRR